MSVKYFFAPNSPSFRKSGGEKKKKEAVTKRYAFQANATKPTEIILCFEKLD